MSNNKPLTKAEMARWVIRSLYALPYLPPAEDRRVRRLVRARSAETMAWQYRVAVRAMESARAAGQTWPSDWL